MKLADWQNKGLLVDEHDPDRILAIIQVSGTLAADLVTAYNAHDALLDALSNCITELEYLRSKQRPLEGYLTAAMLRDSREILADTPRIEREAT